MHITLAFAAIVASTAVTATAFPRDAVPLLQAMSPRNSVSARQVDVGGASLGECAQLRACQDYGTQSVKCVQDFAASDRGPEDYACQCNSDFFALAIECLSCPQAAVFVSRRFPSLGGPKGIIEQSIQECAAQGFTINADTSNLPGLVSSVSGATSRTQVSGTVGGTQGSISASGSGFQSGGAPSSVTSLTSSSRLTMITTPSSISSALSTVSSATDAAGQANNLPNSAGSGAIISASLVGALVIVIARFVM